MLIFGIQTAKENQNANKVTSYNNYNKTKINQIGSAVLENKRTDCLIIYSLTWYLTIDFLLNRRWRQLQRLPALSIRVPERGSRAGALPDAELDPRVRAVPRTVPHRDPLGREAAPAAVLGCQGRICKILFFYSIVIVKVVGMMFVFKVRFGWDF